MCKNQVTVQDYMAPAITVHQMPMEAPLMKTSFYGGHTPGETSGDGSDQGGGHTGGSVDDDTGDAKAWGSVWETEDEDDY